MKDQWFFGLDGGGTKTLCALYNTATDELLTACGGPTNHEALPNGMEDLADAVGSVAFPLLERAGIASGDLAGAAFGMGGVDTPMQHDLIAQILAGMGFERFVLANDAFLGVKAELGRYGISAVNGTGYSVAGISPDGRTLQLGGHGEMTGDRGGGTYLVPAAIRAVYTALFKRGPSTRLTELFFEWLGIDNRDDLCQAVAMQIYQDAPDAYRHVSQLLHQAAAEGDAVARSILTECGRDYALSIQCVAESLALASPVDVVLVGSQFTRCESPCAIDALCESLKASGDYRIHVISAAPVVGALFWAMEKAGVAPKDKSALKARLHDLRGGVIHD